MQTSAEVRLAYCALQRLAYCFCTCTPCATRNFSQRQNHNVVKCQEPCLHQLLTAETLLSHVKGIFESVLSEWYSGLLAIKLFALAQIVQWLSRNRLADPLQGELDLGVEIPSLLDKRPGDIGQHHNTPRVLSGCHPHLFGHGTVPCLIRNSYWSFLEDISCQLFLVGNELQCITPDASGS